MDDCAHFRTIVEDGIDIASAEYGLAKFFLDTGQVEEAIVFTRNGLFGEEGGYKVALSVEPAFRRVFEHGFGGITKVDGGDGSAAAIDIVVIEPDSFDVVEHFVHFG